MQPDKPKLWRIHNLIIGFDILTFGSYKFIDSAGGKRKLIHMNNWNYTREKVINNLGEFTINIQDTGLFKIYCPEMYSESPSEAIGKLMEECRKISADYQGRYSLILKPLRIIREAHRELQNSKILADLFGKHKIMGVYADASGGTNNMESTSDKLENLLDTPERIDKLEIHLIRQTEIMDQFTKQFELHYSVLNDMKETLKAIRETLKR